MSFQCLSCGHKGKQAVQGACPACGSFDLKRTNAKKPEPESKKSLTLKSLAMTILWLFLAYLIIKKVMGDG